MRFQEDRHEDAIHGDELDSAPETTMVTEMEMRAAT